jgi:hypothetical protein
LNPVHIRPFRMAINVLNVIILVEIVLNLPIFVQIVLPLSFYTILM